MFGIDVDPPACNDFDVCSLFTGTTTQEALHLSTQNDPPGSIALDSNVHSVLADTMPSPLTGGVLSNMLLGEDEFTEPMTLLRDITASQAVAKPPGNLESISQIVAHMLYWQNRSLSIIRGECPHYPANQAEKDATWRLIEIDEWDELVSDFLAGLDASMALTESDADISRLIRDDETIGDRIRWTAMHNAYHYGQIVMLRRMLGAWPPEGETC
jgi:uncharacterized damage-inducible protein DinB